MGKLFKSTDLLVLFVSSLYMWTKWYSVLISSLIIPRKKVCQFSNLSELNFKFQLFPQKYDTPHCKLLKHNALSTQTDVAWDLILEMEPISSKSRTVKFFPQKKSSFKYSIDANGCCMEPREKKRANIFQNSCCFLNIDGSFSKTRRF